MEEETQLTCSFVTKLPTELRIPEAPLAIPAKTSRLGLSQVVNQLLALDRPRPFDFLLDGELVRQSLESLVLAHGVSTESVLNIEYILAVAPPKQSPPCQENDWVSAVACLKSALRLSGSYDGSIRVWDGDGACLSITPAHKGGVNVIRPLPTSSSASAPPLLVSAGKDQKARLWTGPPQDAPASHGAHHSATRLTNGSASAQQDTLQAVAVYGGHTDAVQCAAVNPVGSRLATGGWDSHLFLWPTGAEVAASALDGSAAAPVKPSSAARKKRKGEAGSAPAAAIAEPASQAELQGHLQCVSGLAWPSDGTLYSCSWDHQVKRWDTETTACVDTLSGGRALYCIAAAPEDQQVVAFGGADRALRLWDLRVRHGEKQATQSFVSHQNWIVDIAWSPASPHHLLTASHDKTLKLWDKRTSIPLHTLQGHTDKVLCCCWLNGQSVLSGGADNLLQSWVLGQ
ncbi:hypothetical protein WJX74_008517 [Apatococcus lobatus]|uniref:Ribosome biogenesis protein WDR12 homolog n=2 Tax=Apatococcus TaxID=904362 RepID=A0AAW1T237_9CHLO